MKSESKALTEIGLEPFKIHQAFVGLELGATDKPVLEYLDFLTAIVPTDAAYFLHVLPRFDLFNTIYEKEGEAFVSNFELNEAVVRQMSAEIKSKLSNRNAMYVEFDVKEGDPLEELLKDAKAVKADLTIIGQKTGVKRHGILARNLARKISSNALIIPETTKPGLSKILVPIDFSANSARALQTALRVNARLEEPATIICVNVYELPDLSIYKVQKTREQFSQMIKEDREAAFESFLAKYAGDAKEEIKTVLIEKMHPGTAGYLHDFANENEVDLIVIGAKGHSNVELLLLGSVTEKLLALNETTPTLIVKDILE